MIYFANRLTEVATSVVVNGKILNKDIVHFVSSQYMCVEDQFDQLQHPVLDHSLENGLTYSYFIFFKSAGCGIHTESSHIQ